MTITHHCGRAVLSPLPKAPSSTDGSAAAVSTHSATSVMVLIMGLAPAIKALSLKLNSKQSARQQGWIRNDSLTSFLRLRSSFTSLSASTLAKFPSNSATEDIIIIICDYNRFQ